LKIVGLFLFFFLNRYGHLKLTLKLEDQILTKSFAIVRGLKPSDKSQDKRKQLPTYLLTCLPTYLPACLPTYLPTSELKPQWNFKVAWNRSCLHGMVYSRHRFLR